MSVLMRRMETFAVLITVVCAVWGQADGVRPAPVAVPRCCPAGHVLTTEVLELASVMRAVAAAACHPDAEAASKWAPRIYAPARKGYLEPGRLPTHWRVADDALPDCEELRVLREHSAPFALLANNGSLQAVGPQAATLPPDRYCADNSVALACLDELQDGGVAKCCGEGGAFDGTRCVRDPELGARALADLTEIVNGSAPLGGGWPACPGGGKATYTVAGSLRGSRLVGDGALELPEGGAQVPPGTWCAEALTVEAARNAGATEESPTVVLACEGAARGSRPPPPLRHTLYGAGLAVGAAFLAATLAAGFAMPAAHHALHWRCQTHYVAALMVGDVLLAVTQLAGDSIPPTLCRALAVCMHFLFLSAFFWLNTMCFNIWWTFRDFRPTSLERGQEVWRLRVYMLYAWGGPLVVAGTAAILDAAPGAAPLRPRFGERRCWFYGDLEILVYFFGPVGVLLLVNLALFISTTRQLTCGLWRRDEVKSTSERAALGRVCAKLVVVMGVTWGADVISWAVGGPHYVWYATDLLNALQGLLIFLVVGCQRHAWAMVRRWWSRWCGGRAGGGETRRAPHTHSSTHLPSCGESLTHTTNAPPTQPTAPAETPKIPMETVC